MPSNEKLLDIAEAILDGRDVDWAALRRTATTDDVRALVGQLQALQTISRGHRDAQDPPERDEEEHEALIDDYRIVHHLDECLVLARYEVVERQSGARAALNLVKWDIDARAALVAFGDREAELRALASPALGVVFAIGVSPEGRLYLVEPLMHGPTLVEWAREGGIALDKRLSLVADLAESLGRAHRRGVAHGAITPLSVLGPDDEGVARLTGLGLSAVTDIRRLEQRVAARTGRALRFERYLAPEAREPGAAGPSSAGDVFALGALLEDLVPQTQRGLELAALMDRARSTVPDARFPDSSALSLALSDLLSGRPSV